MNNLPSNPVDMNIDMKKDPNERLLQSLHEEKVQALQIRSMFKNWFVKKNYPVITKKTFHRWHSQNRQDIVGNEISQMRHSQHNSGGENKIWKDSITDALNVQIRTAR